MSLVSIRAALENKLDTVSTNFPTAWENVKFTPKVGTPFQQAFLIPAEPENPTMGDDHHRAVGVFQVSLRYPLLKGSGDAMTRAELIKAAFKRGTSMTSGSVTVIVERTPEIGSGYVDDDEWYVLPVRIRWYADVFS